VRNIPVDLSKLTFVCVSPPRPRLVNLDTGEVKVDKQGRTVFQVGLSAADERGRVELVNVNISNDPEVSIGQIVVPVGLVGMPWEQTRNGQTRSGVSYRADQIVLAVAPADLAA
jgi:hypothetical protein